MKPTVKAVVAGAVALGLTAGIGLASPAAAPAAFKMTGLSAVLETHGEGVQLYECKADASGALAWAFREPVATLIADGKTVGRHFAGPTWEMDDGGAVRGKLVATSLGREAGDIPLLKLGVADNRGVGVLKDVTVVLRLETHGGVLNGGCATAGEFRAAPYSATYSFWR